MVVLNPRILVTSGESANIHLQPTIPLGCRRPDALPAFRQESCSVDIEMFDPNSKYSCKDTSVTSISNQKLCGSSLTGWRNTTSQACMHRHNVYQCSYTQIKSHLRSQTIRIAVTNDRLQYPDDKTFTLQLRTGNLAPHTFWQSARLDDVTIIYTGGSRNLEWRRKSCHVQNDPHLCSFDGGYTYMSEFGHYLLYNNTKYSTDVQIKTQPCDADGTSASCTCAVAIQAGGDVFLMDICDKIKRASFIHCRSNKLNAIEKTTNTDYEIYLPTGTKVEVHMKHYSQSDFLNVYIYPSPSDVRNTEGLCGNLTGQRDETLNSIYISKWRLQHSLFNTVRYDHPSTWTYDYNVCICPRAIPGATVPTSNSNGDKDSSASCFSQQYATCTESTNLQGERKVCTIRNKRSTERHRRNIERLHALAASHISSHDRMRKSTTNVQLTEAQAYKECLDVFKSKPTYSMVGDLPSSVSLNESLSSCVNDMVVDGRAFWKEENYNSWVCVISQEIGRNGTFRREKENVVRRFRSVTCPSQCHGNGDCVNGTCICKDDYVGVSCFVKKSDPLELTDIEGGGECDLAYGDDCHECLQFHTVNLLKGFKCKIDTHDLDENGTVVQSTEHKRNGEYDSIFDGYCCPSAAEERRKRSTEPSGFTVRYSISISNDGIHFGPSRNVHVFDSTCQTYVVMANGEWMFSLR
ncbi:von Willebrand factor D and EGF domain-containing protein-like, partial [Mercenaria mercenaria]|uniref:von Willebrand factor D and EGF domain-containing protein-like n=1 Tax=Mercenaria mercenaria TaxID=6596 RepID=UPI00234EC4BD